MTLYAFARHRTGRPILCGSMAQNLAHELGHFLGLRHTARDPQCTLDIMSTVKRVNSRKRRVSEEECQAVDWLWRSEGEVDPSQPLDELLASLRRP